MSSPRIEKLNRLLDEIEKKADNKVEKTLHISKYKRMIARLDSLSVKCEECESYLGDIEFKLEDLVQEQTLTGSALKYFHRIFTSPRYHLRKKHHIVDKGYYSNLYLYIGVGIGAALTPFLFMNIALGVGVGVGIGLAIGGSLDKEAKRKGLVL